MGDNPKRNKEWRRKRGVKQTVEEPVNYLVGFYSGRSPQKSKAT